MKIGIAIGIAIALAALVIWTLPRPAADSAVETLPVDVPLEGMTCLACVAKVNQTLGALEGVENASADLAGRRVSIDYDPDKIDRSQIVEVLREIGYKPGKPERREEE